MISADVVGQTLPVVAEELSLRRVLAFAAGIGDSAPAVFDDLGPIAAPPSLCVSLEWPLLSHPSLREQLGAEPAELLRGVHVTQDSSFHRPMRPGMRVETRGTTTALRATRAGALQTLRAETRAAEGALVTSWIQVLYRGVAIDGEARTLESAPPRPELESAGELERCALPIARELPHVYSECARIWNPIHTERRVAQAAGLPDIILHGSASWALAGREIVARHAGGDPSRLRRLRGEFRGMLVPGADAELRHADGRRSDGAHGVAFTLHDAAGSEAISHGFAELTAD